MCLILFQIFANIDVWRKTIYFYHLPPTSSHLHSLQVENCDSNSRLVVDEDNNGIFRLERVNRYLIKSVWKEHKLLNLGTTPSLWSGLVWSNGKLWCIQSENQGGGGGVLTPSLKITLQTHDCKCYTFVLCLLGRPTRMHNFLRSGARHMYIYLSSKEKRLNCFNQPFILVKETKAYFPSIILLLVKSQPYSHWAHYF